VIAILRRKLLMTIMVAGIAPHFESFDGDESLLLLVSIAMSVYGLVYWAIRLRPVSKFGAAPFHRTPIYAALFTGFLFLAWVIWKWADQQIRDNSGYVLLVVVMGSACLTLACAVLPWLGISLRDDAFEQRNFSAMIALSGAMLGVLITYAMASAGNGPSFWNNVFSCLLATGSLLAAWLMIGIFGSSTVSITQERDLASGVRLGAFSVAEALIFGRAVAGDWESMEATTRDFIHDGWPAIVLCLAAIIIERLLRPTSRNPQPALMTHGYVPGSAYLLAAIIWCVHLGWWKGAAS
jgi:hypothetical protein